MDDRNTLAADTLQAANKLRSLCWPLDQYANQALCLATEHPFLLPEINAANGHVAEALNAINRAMDALNARLDAAA